MFLYLNIIYLQMKWFSSVVMYSNHLSHASVALYNADANPTLFFYVFTFSVIM